MLSRGDLPFALSLLDDDVDETAVDEPCLCLPSLFDEWPSLCFSLLLRDKALLPALDDDVDAADADNLSFLLLLLFLLDDECESLSPVVSNAAR